MQTITLEKLVETVKNRDSEEIASNEHYLNEKIMEFIRLFDDNEKKNIIEWCHKEEIFLIHKIFGKVEKIEDIVFIKNKLQFYKKNFLLDNLERTWLHVAVQFERNVDIIIYLVQEMDIDVEKVDTFKFTALHYACNKVSYAKGELDILIKQSDQLLALSIHDMTPLELACGDLKKLKEIKKNKNINIYEIICQIDKNDYGLPETEEYYFNEKMSVKTMWLNLLQINDKRRLIYLMKKDSNFNKKYFLSVNEIKSIISKCHENGQGIITYLKTKYPPVGEESFIENVFKGLTGLKVETTKVTIENENVFYRSSLFLALITGRFELIPSLLCFCQFEIIPYGLLTCLICHSLSHVSDFPDQVVDNIRKVKEFCEKYSIAVLNQTVSRDITSNKQIISGFLNKFENYGNQRILDIAYSGKCAQFLGLPSCQDALTNLWYQKNRKCPAIKFYLHSIFHCIFLTLLSYILLNDFYAKISIIEIICYSYGFGYFIEEVRQLYISFSQNGVHVSYFREATNQIDMGALLSMIIAGILRMGLTIESIQNQGYRGLYEESKNFNLFFIRLIMCISLILFFMRVIYFGSIFEQVGPKLKMIAKMIVSDLIPLIFIFLVFIISFGVAFQSLMFPNSFYTVKGNNSFEKKTMNVVIATIFRRSTFTIFDTHYPFEELDHDEGGYVVNNEGRTATYFLLIIYMVVVNIMLTNLLIALFSNTVTVIIQKSRESWKAKRYKDITEYYERSLFPPPFNLLEIIIELIIKLFQKIKSKRVETNEEIRMLAKHDEELQKTQFISFKILQAFALKDCRYKLLKNEDDEKYERKLDIKSIKEGIDRIERKLK